MAPFRPSNLNKRAYPGNASVIGPTKTTSCSVSNTVCCTFTSRAGFSTTTNPQRGCRIQASTCFYCDTCACCACDVTTRTIPGGMWKTTEQYEARERDAWGAPTHVTGPIGSLTTNQLSCANSPCDCSAFYLGNDLWVAASDTEASGAYQQNCCPAVNNAKNNTGYNNGWFIGSKDTWGQCAYPCRSYWDSYNTNSKYYSSTAGPGSQAWWTCMADGQQGCGGGPNNRTQIWCGRAFRKTLDAPQ